MVIDLTRNEKTTFFRFLGLYLGSSFILLTIIFWQFYKIEYKLYYDLVSSNMQNIASKISANIIYADMSNLAIDTSKISNSIQYKYALYDKNHVKLAGNIDIKVDINQAIQKIKGDYVLVDSSPRGHLGVFHIAIQENSFKKIRTELLEDIIFYFILIFALISLVGYYLANLFIDPIINERRKLNTFIKDTTHELNTPITAILMSTGKDAPLTEKNMQRINLSAKRISEIYKDLVYLFLQDNKKIHEPTMIYLDDVIKEQLEYFQAFATKKKLTINSNLERTAFKIDKESFIRMFNNVVSNAIKYNKIGGEISVSLKNHTLIVEDSGIGIKKDRLKDIFKRYYRATKEQGGFGVGLNIVYHICRTYGIKIDVKSVESQGSIFTFKLPKEEKL
ncbi:sensor histidine kinase [Halarcobacter bivalviorum]|uniref:histidine kinase n=2 Tax=Halarcobacter bivalviorum TaxID=663364 RepID=A0AB33GHD2_9BACT|nr:HAMP domain-containing sensor histidine kinase [Halarcobacter bivalviorum]AXH11145.1 two-component system sensor histidine kinase [Halarcobacter bivalviorum]